MKQIRSVLMFWFVFTMLLGLPAFYNTTFASSATSGSFRIDKPQVILQGNTNNQSIISLDQRTSPSEALEFYNKGILFQYGTRSSLSATIGTQLVEFDEKIPQNIKIPIYASSKNTYEYLHVRRNFDLYRSVTFDTKSNTTETGTSGSIHLPTTPELINLKSYLGTLRIIIGAY